MTRKRMVGYWIVTLYVALTALGSGALDVVHAQPLFGIMLHLGYPAHFATVLGVWKILGGAALLVPRAPVIKEWAYAGLFIDFSSAIVAHSAAGDSVDKLFGPLIGIAMLAVSWWLRPESRRLAYSPVG